MRALAFVLALATLGCSERATPAATSASAKSSASAAPKKSKLVGFTATVDGKELILDSALAFSRGGAALHITLSTHPVPCDKIAGAGFKLEPGEFLVDFTVAPTYAPGAKMEWQVTGSRLGDVSRQGALGKAKGLLVDPRRTVKLSFEKTSLVFPPTKLVLDGDLTAAGCGIIPLTERAEVRRQKNVKVVLNDKEIALNGASLAKVKGKRTLRLTSEPHACDKGVQGSDVALAIRLSEDGAAESVVVTGFSIPRPLRSKPGETPATVQLDDQGDPAEMNVAVAANLELAGTSLVMDGVARAQLCP